MKALALIAFIFGMVSAEAAEVHVMISGGFAEAYGRLVALFTERTKHTVVTARGPSMGETSQAIPNRLRRGEHADVIIMVDSELDALTKDGKVRAASKAELAKANIGVAVRAGAPKPDISTLDAFRRAMLEARSVAYSDSASGVYLANVVFHRLGIVEQMKGKARMIPADPVAAVVARGEAELGVQTLSALVPVPGIDIVGILPAEIQKATVFAAGIASAAKEPEAAGALIDFLTSSAAAPVIRQAGMEPLGAR